MRIVEEIKGNVNSGSALLPYVSFSSFPLRLWIHYQLPSSMGEGNLYTLLLLKCKIKPLKYNPCFQDKQENYSFSITMIVVWDDEQKCNLSLSSKKEIASVKWEEYEWFANKNNWRLDDVARFVSCCSSVSKVSWMYLYLWKSKETLEN